MINITNLPNNAVKNDITYDGRYINIYANVKEDHNMEHVKGIDIDFPTCEVEDDSNETKGKGGIKAKGKILRVRIQIVSLCPVHIKATTSDGKFIFNVFLTLLK